VGSFERENLKIRKVNTSVFVSR